LLIENILNEQPKFTHNNETFGLVFKKSVNGVITEENSKEGDSSCDASGNQKYS
jgi:hypothetical protein